MICQWIALDRAILRHLQADGRLTNVELAERVRLSPSPCLRRVRALERAGVIRGYHADIDPAAVGRGFEVTVHVELTLKDRATVEAFETGIAALDEVIECRRMFGLPDYVIRVAVADQAAYEAFYMNELAELPGLARVNSQFTMKMVKAAAGCRSTAERAPRDNRAHAAEQQVSLRADRRADRGARRLAGRAARPAPGAGQGGRSRRSSRSGSGAGSRPGTTTG